MSNYTEESKKIYNEVCDKYKHHWLDTTITQTMAMEMITKALAISRVSKSLPRKDAEFIYSLLPDWVKSKAPEGLDLTMYGTLSKKGDDEIQQRVKQILGNV